MQGFYGSYILKRYVTKAVLGYPLSFFFISHRQIRKKRTKAVTGAVPFKKG